MTVTKGTLLELSFWNAGECQLAPVPTDLECKHVLCEPTNLPVLFWVRHLIIFSPMTEAHTVYLDQLLWLASNEVFIHHHRKGHNLYFVDGETGTPGGNQWPNPSPTPHKVIHHTMEDTHLATTTPTSQIHSPGTLADHVNWGFKKGNRHCITINHIAWTLNVSAHQITHASTHPSIISTT